MKHQSMYLGHILDAIARVETYVAIGRERFFAEPVFQDATIRQLEIIGEATKHLSTELRGRHLEIDWRRIAGLRDVLIHNYMGVDLNVVWDVTQLMLPKLKRTVQTILDEQLHETGER